MYLYIFSLGNKIIGHLIVLFIHSPNILSTYCELAKILSDEQSSYASLMIKILVGEINNKQTEMLFLKKEHIQNLLR